MTTNQQDSVAAIADDAETISRFETSWKAGKPVNISDCVPAESRTNTDLLVELACIDLQYRLRNGEDRRVESYVGEFPSLASDELILLELVRTEWSFRNDREDLRLEEFTRRFPGLMSHLKLMFQLEVNRDGISHAAEPEAEWVCSGCHCKIGSLSTGSTKCPGCGAPVAIGRYQLLQQVGEGAFGYVYRARDPKLDREVALKLPRVRQFLIPAESERFLRESRNAAQLDHPGIVRIHDAGKHEETPYIVSEFVAGQTLNERLKEGEFSFEQSARLVLRMSQAVAHAHGRGVIHRDLKPANVMTVDGPGGEVIPRIMDFGLARRDQVDVSMTMEGQAVGTPAYMSPEQARGASNSVNERSDIYSLGVILFQLLCGELPFRGNVQMLIQQVISDDPPSPSRFRSRIPRDLETICLKCIRREPAGRYESAQQLADELQRFLDGRPVHARRIGLAGRTARWCRRRPAIAALLGGLVMAITAGVSGIAWQWQQAEVARAESETDLADSMESVERVLDHLGSSALDDVPQAKQLRIEVLTDAAEFYKRFLQRNPHDPRIGLQVAKAHSAIGQIEYELGQYDEAEEHFDQSLLLLKQLQPNAPDRMKWLVAVGSVYLRMGNIHMRTGDRSRARAAYADRIRIREEILGLDPDSGKAMASLATSRTDYARSLDSSDWPQAEQLFTQAIEQLRSLAAERRKVGYWRDLGRVLTNYAVRLDANGQKARAQECRAEAIVNYEKAVAADPRDESVRASYAGVCMTAMDKLREQSRTAEAREYQQKAIAAYQKLTDDFPATPRHRERFAEVCRHVASVNSDPSVAIDACEQAIVQQEMLVALFPQRTEYLWDLASSLGDIARLQIESNQKAEAERRLRERLQLRKQLLDTAEEAGVARCKANYAIACQELASLIGTSKLARKKEETKRLLKRVEDTVADLAIEQITDDDEMSPANKLKLLASLTTLATARNDHPRTEACYLARIELGKMRVEAKPESSSYKSRLATDWNLLAKFFKEQHETDKALDAFANAMALAEEVLAADPQSEANIGMVIRYGVEVGHLLRYSDRPIEAIPTLRRVLELNRRLIANKPDEAYRKVRSALTLITLGEILAADGQWEEAHSQMRECLELRNAMVAEPGMDQFICIVDDTVAWFLVKCEDERFVNPVDAIELARNAVAARPDNGLYHRTLAFALYVNGQFDESVAEVKRIMELDSENLGIDRSLMAMSLAKLGQIDEARDMLKSARQWQANQDKSDPMYEDFSRLAESLLETK